MKPNNACFFYYNLTRQGNMNTKKKNTVRILNEVLILRHDSTQKLFNNFHDDKKKNLQTYYGKFYVLVLELRRKMAD